MSIRTIDLNTNALIQSFEELPKQNWKLPLTRRNRRISIGEPPAMMLSDPF